MRYKGSLNRLARQFARPASPSLSSTVVLAEQSQSYSLLQSCRAGDSLTVCAKVVTSAYTPAELVLDSQIGLSHAQHMAIALE